MNKGPIRATGTDFTYEELEGLLASYFLSLKPLLSSSDLDERKDCRNTLKILNGFAERHDFQKPKDAAAHPRINSVEYGYPKVFVDNSDFLGSIEALWHDFGIGGDPRSFDGEELAKVKLLLLSILRRRGIIFVLAKWLHNSENQSLDWMV